MGIEIYTQLFPSSLTQDLQEFLINSIKEKKMNELLCLGGCHKSTHFFISKYSPLSLGFLVPFGTPSVI